MRTSLGEAQTADPSCPTCPESLLRMREAGGSKARLGPNRRGRRSRRPGGCACAVGAGAASVRGVEVSPEEGLVAIGAQGGRPCPGGGQTPREGSCTGGEARAGGGRRRERVWEAGRWPSDVRAGWWAAPGTWRPRRGGGRSPGGRWLGRPCQHGGARVGVPTQAGDRGSREEGANDGCLLRVTGADHTRGLDITLF